VSAPRRLNRTLAGALVATALAAPAAAAYPADEIRGANKHRRGLEAAQIRAAERSFSAPGRPAFVMRGVSGAPTVTTVDPGFDWGSAVIGAGAASTVLLLTAAGAMTVAQRGRPGGKARAGT
jgi:hypothetical protein